MAVFYVVYLPANAATEISSKQIREIFRAVYLISDAALPLLPTIGDGPRHERNDLDEDRAGVLRENQSSEISTKRAAIHRRKNISCRRLLPYRACYDVRRPCLLSGTRLDHRSFHNRHRSIRHTTYLALHEAAVSTRSCYSISVLISSRVHCLVRFREAMAAGALSRRHIF